MLNQRKGPENIIPIILDVHPLVLELGKNLTSFLNPDEAQPILNDYLQKEAALSQGIVLPPLKIRRSDSLCANGFAVKIREVLVHRGEMKTSRSKESILTSLREKLSAIVKRYAYEFLGQEEVQEFLEHLRLSHQKIVQSVYPSLLGLSEIHRVLQNLLREGVPIRDLTKILEVLGAGVEHTRDPEILTEYVRRAMPRVLGGLYQEGFTVRAYVLEEKIEQWISGAVRWENQVVLDLHADLAKKILRALDKKFRSSRRANKGKPVLLVHPEIRRFVKILTEQPFPSVPVLSYAEIAPEYKVKILGTIRLDPWKDRFEKVLSFLKIKNQHECFPGDSIQKTLVILNLIGAPANLVARYLSPFERETLTTRSLIAPVPTQGKDEVLCEFLDQIPPEKNVACLEDLCKFAEKDPVSVALILQKDWLSHLAGQELDAAPMGSLAASDRGGRNETSAREKAAIFVTSATHWMQNEVYRYLTFEELRELGRGMLQFPFISVEGKRKAWEEYEGILHKDEWWDPDTLVRFLRASLNGEIENFKKRGFRQTQKVAILLLSLPAQILERIGKMVLDNLTKTDLQQVLEEMGQWRDALPPEARSSVIQEFLRFASSRHRADFQCSNSFLQMEVERIASHDLKGTIAVMRFLWFSLRDPRTIFETIALRTPTRVANYLLDFLYASDSSQIVPPQSRFYFFINSLDLKLKENIKRELSVEEKENLRNQIPPSTLQKTLFKEFLRGYYGGSYPTPLPFLKRN